MNNKINKAAAGGRPLSTSGRLLKLGRAAGRTVLAVGLAWACLWPVPPARAAAGYVAVACLRRNADQCGIINEQGEWVTPPGFDKIGDFAPNGLAVAVKRQRPGVIDTRGEWVIPPGFDRVDEVWSAGLIKVGRADRKAAGFLYGLADEAGRLIVEPSFRVIQNFGPNRLAGACDREARCGFINTQGDWVIPAVFEQVDDFAENGLAPARRLGEERWGYIDAAGDFVIPPSYDQAFPFDGDRAKVMLGGSYGLINPKGQEVGRKFASLGDFDSGGLASGQEEVDGLFGLVNRNGLWAAAPNFERVYSFGGGHLAPAQKDGLFGFINRGGRWIIKPAFGNVDDFESRGRRAPAELSGAWGLIDAEGRWVVEPDYLLLLNSSGVRGPIQVFADNGRWGLMDENGQWLLEPLLTASPYFADNGLSEAKVGDLYGFIDRSGRWAVEPFFQQVGVFRLVPEVPPAVFKSARSASTPDSSKVTRFQVGALASAKPRPAAPKPPPKNREETREDRRRQEPSPTRFIIPEPVKPKEKTAEAGPAEADAPPTAAAPPAAEVETGRPVRPPRPARASAPAASAPPAAAAPPPPEPAEPTPEPPEAAAPVEDLPAGPPAQANTRARFQINFD